MTVLQSLRRWPDVEAPNLYAVDGADRLLLDTAAEELAAGGVTAIVGDNYGALTLGAASRYGCTGLRVHQDALTGERALDRNAAELGLTDRFTHYRLDASLFDGATTILLRMPRSLAAIAEIAELAAVNAAPGVKLLAAGMDKHLSRTMNEVLGRSFASVKAGHGRHKARVITATGPKPGEFTYPQRAELTDIGVRVVAHGGAFGGSRLDLGTRFLLGFLDEMTPDAELAVDLGCGTGVLATVLAQSRPGLRIIAADQSYAAVRSTIETVIENSVADRVQVIRDDALDSLATASADLVVCNPPFHTGAAVHASVGIKLLEGAARVLRPGGELWTVYNSHLNYRDKLKQLVGSTRVVGRNGRYTVTCSVRRPQQEKHG